MPAASCSGQAGRLSGAACRQVAFGIGPHGRAGRPGSVGGRNRSSAAAAPVHDGPAARDLSLGDGAPLARRPGRDDLSRMRCLRTAGDALDSTSNLTLDARRLGISPATSCTSAASGKAHPACSANNGCSAAMRATYVDSSGSMVATVTVAVLPSTSAAGAVVRDCTGSGSSPHGRPDAAHRPHAGRRVR